MNLCTMKIKDCFVWAFELNALITKVFCLIITNKKNSGLLVKGVKQKGHVSLPKPLQFSYTNYQPII